MKKRLKELINNLIIWVEHNSEIIIVIFFIIFVIALIYSFFLFLFASNEQKLQYLGEFIGVPASIFITAFFSNHEFNKEQRNKNIRFILNNIYKIVLGLRNIEKASGSLSYLYQEDTSKKILSDRTISSVAKLTDLSDIEIVTTNFNLLREQIYINQSLRNRSHIEMKKAQKELTNIIKGIDYISHFKNTNLEIREHYIKNIHDGCTNISIGSLKLRNLLQSIQSNIYE